MPPNAIPADVVDALENAEEFELISLDPNPVEEPNSSELPLATSSQAEPADAAEKPPKLRQLQGWPELGSTVIREAAARKKLVAALRKGVDENKGIAAACFFPRHAIRVVYGGKTYEILICFQCLQASVYTNNEQTKGFLLTKTPQPTFDGLLKEGKVPLPEAAN